MEIVPVQPVPSQTLNTRLGDQQCSIKIMQKSNGMYISLRSDGVDIATGVICRNMVPTVRYKYLGFVGDIAFRDTEGDSDPRYSGLGTRWKLFYLTPEDL